MTISLARGPRSSPLAIAIPQTSKAISAIREKRTKNNETIQNLIRADLPVPAATLSNSISPSSSSSATRSEEHTYELHSLLSTSYAHICLKTKKADHTHNLHNTTSNYTK